MPIQPVENFPIITGAEGEIYIDEIGADLDQAGCLVVVYARWYHKGNRQQMELVSRGGMRYSGCVHYRRKHNETP